jgi:hypothetical protein
MTARNMIDRLEHVGSTDTSKLVEAFENFHYDAAKKAGAYFRACDHQAVQQTYAGVIVDKSKRRTPKEYFTIGATVGGDYAAETCANPDSTAASKIFASEKIPARDGYTVISLK